MRNYIRGTDISNGYIESDNSIFIDPTGFSKFVSSGDILTGRVGKIEKFGVVAVDTANGFNADLHQAVGIDPNAKSNEIGTVLQKGYSLNGRLLRPAMVMVGA